MPAPIIIFSYKRFDGLKSLIQSLRSNKLSADSDLIIYSDGPKNEDDWPQIQECRDYASSITGFLSVKLISRPVNLGLSESIITGVSETLKKYEEVIVLEDDLIVSPYFLKYMNDSLKKYSDSKDVVCIHGYVYPVKDELPNTFFLKGADCWGWGTWRRGWQIFNKDSIYLLGQLKMNAEINNFNFNGCFDYVGMLRDQIKGKNDSWAIRWHASAFLENKLTLYPGVSLVSNIGNNGLGTHQSNSKIFDVEVGMEPIVLCDIPVRHSDSCAKIFEKYFLEINGGWFGWLKIRIKNAMGSIYD